VSDPGAAPQPGTPEGMHGDEPSFANKIVRGALNQKFLVVIAALVLIGVGSWSFSRLPVDAYPDLSPPMVEITTQWPGHASEEVERLVTVPIETEMNGVERIKVVRSVSLYGLSDIRLTFKDGTDPYFARQRVFEHLPDATLPTGVTAGVAPLFSPSGLVYRYVVDSPDRSAMELKVINDWILTKAFKSVPGVADMANLGGKTMQYQVLVDPTKLAGAGLAISDVATALGANNDNSGGGFYSEGGQFYYVRGLARLNTTEDIGQVVVKTSSNGIPVLVRDIGSVEIGYAPRLGQFGFNDRDDAVEGVILMRTGEQAQTVLKGVEAKTKELNEHILPKDVKIHTFYDRVDLIALTTRVVEDNLLRGIVLVVVVLVFFLFDVRAGLVVATTIPLALLFAFICLDLKSIPANLLSIGAIDFGILVDGAVVMVENIHRQLAARIEGRKRLRRRER
jgi:cobalt-zinc-cadmium resistance protein CzcA